MSFNSPDFVKVFFGVLKAGGVVVPLNHKLIAPEVTYILENSAASVLFFDSALSEVAQKVSVPLIKISMNGQAEGFASLGEDINCCSGYAPVEVADSDFAEILYTSGTTGKPKGCLHTHRNVIFAGITGAMCMKMDEHDRLLMAMPIWHSSPLNNWFMGAQYVGATTVLLWEYHPLHFFLV